MGGGKRKFRNEEAAQGVFQNGTGCCCTGKQQPECVPVCESAGLNRCNQFVWMQR